MIAKFNSVKLKNTITFQHLEDDNHPNHLGVVIEYLNDPIKNNMAVALSPDDLFNLIGYLLTIQKKMKEVNNG